jgi:FtsH-binding integral membrane protein
MRDPLDVMSTPAEPAEHAEHAPATALRRLLALPGSVLLVCFFLPAVKVCNVPEAPYRWPPFWAPYLGGIALVLLAMSHRHRMRAAALIVLTALWTATTGFVLTALVVSIAPRAAAGLGTLAALGAVALCVVIGRRRWTSGGAAGFAIAHGILATLWGLLLHSDPTHMYGADVTLATAVAALALAIAWARVCRLGAVAPVPIATTRRR